MQVASVATSYSALKLLFMFLPITSGVIAGAHNTKALFSLNGDKPWEVWFARCAGLPPLLTLVAATHQVLDLASVLTHCSHDNVTHAAMKLVAFWRVI